MTEEEARAKAIKEWRLLPLSERMTADHAAIFAQTLALRGLTYEGCKHPYHFIKGWLQRDLKGGK